MGQFSNNNDISIPPNTEHGRIELSSRVQLKLNKMMKNTEYTLDPRWQYISWLASSHLYNAQKTAYILLKNLEIKKIKKIIPKISIISPPVSPNNAISPHSKLHKIDEEKEEDSISSFDSFDAANFHKIDEEKCENTMGLQNSLKLEIDEHGLPILADKSKYKIVATEFCQKMGWKVPLETTQCVAVGHRAMVTFGETGKEQTKSGKGLRQKDAIYEAYIKLVPIVIPKEAAFELMIKWIPGYKK